MIVLQGMELKQIYLLIPQAEQPAFMKRKGLQKKIFLQNTHFAHLSFTFTVRFSTRMSFMGEPKVILRNRVSSD